MATKKGIENTNKRGLRLLIALAVFVIIVMFSLIEVENKEKLELSNFNELYNGNTSELIYIGRPTCSYCTYMEPTLDSLKEEFGFEYTYINSDEISSTILEEIVTTMVPGTNMEEFGTPFIAVVKNGETIAYNPGYMPEEDLYDFLIKAEFLTEEQQLTLNYIEAEELVETSKTGKNLYVLATPVNFAVIEMLDGLKQISNEENITFNVIDIRVQEDADLIASTFSLYQESSSNITIPSAIIVENGEITAELTYTSVESFKALLENNGMLGE